MTKEKGYFNLLFYNTCTPFTQRFFKIQKTRAQQSAVAEMGDRMVTSQ